jgi:hypothetical protein
MFPSIHRRIFAAALLMALNVIVAAAADPPAVLLLDGSGLSWREARQIIEQYGGRVDVVAVPSVIVGRIPDSAVAALIQFQQPAQGPALAAALAAIRVVRTRAAAEALLGVTPGGAVLAALAPGGGGLSAEAQAALRLLAPQNSTISQSSAALLPGGIAQQRQLSDFESPPLLREPRDPRLANALGTTFWNTSGFLAGDIAVGIIRPESTGLLEPSTEDWTAQEVTTTLANVMAALAKLTSNSPRGKVTFVVRTETFGPGASGTVSSDYEAFQHSNWTSFVVLDFLGKLGYTQPARYERLVEWVNDLRSDLQTDWAFGYVVVDNSSDRFAGRASAYLLGPAAWMFGGNPLEVYHHEAGHIWGARDEYHPDAAQSPVEPWGYTQVPNANSEYNDGTGFFSGAGEGVPSLMLSSADYASPWARGAWGIWDLDGDGINDTQDTFPAVTVNSPTGTSTFTFTGTATATTLTREIDPSWIDADITINKIVTVEWRMNGGPWQNATPSDGSFNASTENYTVTTPALRNGPYFLEVRARDNFGNATQNLPRVAVTATGSAVTNNVPAAALTATPALGSIATVFAFNASGSLDYEDSGNLEYRWDFDNDGTYETALSANSAATQSYGSAGSKTAKVEVRDQGGAVSTRTVSFTVSAANTAPTATFTVDKGSQFASMPVIFNFDASGVSDGEDAASTLQVRWDFEDDGLWDTSFSTTKTIANDYAQGFPIITSNETGDLFTYTGRTTLGYAQSFVAGSSPIGSAGLYLVNETDDTPGGTCTIGIRSVLDGSFLTSVTTDEASFVNRDWNNFDFADITLTNGATYFLAIICSDGDMVWLSSSGNAYAGGQHYNSDDGLNWVTISSYDHRFRIYGDTVTAIPLTKSRAWSVRLEVKDANGQTTQTVRDIWANGYDTPPTVSLGSSALSGTTATMFNLTATGADANSGTTWDTLLHYRWDVDGDGNFETAYSTTNTRNASFTLPGVYAATVEVRDLYHATARASVNITVTPTSGATQIQISGGNNQSGSTNSTLPVAAAVLVRDAGNNPVAGVLVVFSVASGGGKITNATQVTNGSGIATLGSWALGAAAGANSLEVRMPHFPQTTALTFNATANGSRTLTTSRAGTGTGTVTSNPVGISCGATCSFDFSDGASVTLTATSAQGSDFSGWNGSACSGVGICQVTMDTAKTVTATFATRKRRGQITSN